MTLTEIIEFKNYIALMSAQLGHLGDGRGYMLQCRLDGGWVDLVTVKSTVLCDYGTRWLLAHGAVRPRGLPVKLELAAPRPALLDLVRCAHDHARDRAEKQRAFLAGEQ